MLKVGAAGARPTRAFGARDRWSVRSRVGLNTERDTCPHVECVPWNNRKSKAFVMERMPTRWAQHRMERMPTRWAHEIDGACMCVLGTTQNGGLHDLFESQNGNEILA